MTAQSEPKTTTPDPFLPSEAELESARENHSKRPKGQGGSKNVRHKALVFPSVNVSAMRFSSILGHNGVSLADTELALARLGIVTGKGKNRKGPTEGAVRMRHRCTQLEWAMSKRWELEDYRALARVLVGIVRRVKAGQTLAQIGREVGFEVRYVSGADAE